MRFKKRDVKIGFLRRLAQIRGLDRIPLLAVVHRLRGALQAVLDWLSLSFDVTAGLWSRPEDPRWASNAAATRRDEGSRALGDTTLQDVLRRLGALEDDGVNGSTETRATWTEALGLMKPEC